MEQKEPVLVLYDREEEYARLFSEYLKRQKELPWQIHTYTRAEELLAGEKSGEVPRGYIDGFVGWCKQVIGLCLTAFLQATVLIAGLMVVKDQALLGLGLMLSAGEIPRIAGQFGLETGTKANVMGAVYAAQGAMNLTRTVVQVVSK